MSGVGNRAFDTPRVKFARSDLAGKIGGGGTSGKEVDDRRGVWASRSAGQASRAGVHRCNRFAHHRFPRCGQRARGVRDDLPRLGRRGRGACQCSQRQGRGGKDLGRPRWAEHPARRGERQCDRDRAGRGNRGTGLHPGRSERADAAVTGSGCSSQGREVEAGAGGLRVATRPGPGRRRELVHHLTAAQWQDRRQPAQQSRRRRPNLEAGGRPAAEGAR